ncbi:MAG: Kazal-type serine protease inhibitor domain-containing protein, partial [Saprospiraceae bacterium]
MTNKLPVLSLFLCLILFTSMTCNQKGTGGENQTSIECIDKSKINSSKPCTKEYKPVCGCNNETYSNSCMAEKAGITSWTEGKCGDCIDGSKINPTAVCTMQYAPVCGCNGVTYGNECMAKNAGVLTWKSGDCKTQIDD